MKREQRTEEDIMASLEEQINLLSLNCEQYDNGREYCAKTISTIIRILVKDTRNSKSLLGQLGMKSQGAYTSATQISSTNLLSEFPLIVIRQDSSGTRWIPLKLAGVSFKSSLISFDDWWAQPVLKDSNGVLFTRSDLISHVADTDGGAHSDPGLDPDYRKLSRENSIGWTATNGDSYIKLDGKPELACVRQIAHELMLALWVVHNKKPSHTYKY